MKVYVLGAGGVGSWLTPAMCRLIGNENVTVIDGDKLEKKNLDRQLFNEADIGRFKAEALAEKYGCAHMNEWYSFGMMEHLKSDTLMVCVDNHPARVAALMACDYEGCRAIFAANERTSAEAYLYTPRWKGTNLDPRVTDPGMVNDHSGDPRSEAIGCTGEAQQATPQLVSANLMAGALALHLYTVWMLEAPKMEKETLEHLPFKLVQNLSRSESFKATVNKPQTKGQTHECSDSAVTD